MRKGVDKYSTRFSIDILSLFIMNRPAEELVSESMKFQSGLARKALELSRRIVTQQQLKVVGNTIDLGNILVKAGYEEDAERKDKMKSTLTITSAHNPALSFTITTHHVAGSGSLSLIDPHGEKFRALGAPINRDVDSAESELIEAIREKLEEVEKALDSSPEATVDEIADAHKSRATKLLKGLQILDDDRAY